MKNIAISGVGGGVGQSIIKALQKLNYNLIGLDGEVLAAGLYTVPKAYIIPYAYEENYIKKLLQICKKENISILFPGLDAELLPLSRNREKFEKIGTKVIVSRPEVINIADDKLLTYNYLRSKNINVPKTVLMMDFIKDKNLLDFPVIMKPMKGGARSKNVFKINNLDEFLLLGQMVKNFATDYIVQEFIEGDEYTCGSVTLNGKCFGAIIMKRILRNGDTYKCFVEDNDLLKQLVIKIAEVVQPFGALNVQLITKDNVPYIVELNARCSGTTAARALCGFNEPQMIAEYILSNIIPHYLIKKQSILRYYKEIVLNDDDIDTLAKDKQIKLHRIIRL